MLIASHTVAMVTYSIMKIITNYVLTTDWAVFWYHDCSVSWRVAIMTHRNLRLGKCWKLFWATLIRMCCTLPVPPIIKPLAIAGEEYSVCWLVFPFRERSNFISLYCISRLSTCEIIFFSHFQPSDLFVKYSQNFAHFCKLYSNYILIKKKEYFSEFWIRRHKGMEATKEQSFILTERRDKDNNIAKLQSKNKLLITSALSLVIMECWKRKVTIKARKRWPPSN